MKSPGLNEQQLQKMKAHPGFIAALDQSGGRTALAVRLYGIQEGAWSDEEEMIAIVHQMRTRIITSPSFTGERIIAAILFENAMDRDVEKGQIANYLWNVKRVVPFLKVDKGLAAEFGQAERHLRRLGKVAAQEARTADDPRGAGSTLLRT